MKTFIFILLGSAFLGNAFLLGNVNGAEPADQQVKRLDIQDREMLAEWTQVPRMGTLSLSLQNVGRKNQIKITLKGGSSQVDFLPKEQISALRRRQIRALEVPSFTDGKTYRLTLRRKADAWILYLERTPVLRLPEIWSGPMSVLHPKSATPAGDAKDEYAQRLGTFAFADAFMIPKGAEFPQTWEKMSGLWKLHSVTGSVSGSSMGYKLARQPLPHKSPNFYTMEGSGTNAVLLAGEPFYGHYRCRASIQHNSGTNGLVFLAGERGGYYAFTAQTAPQTQCVVLDLWRQTPDKNQKPVFLDTIQTAIPIGQWLMLEVRLFDDRLICLADNIEVIRHRIPLPPCGRFGLFANVPIQAPTRFDDVSAHSQEDILLDSPDDLALAVHASSPLVKTSQKDGKNWIEFPAGNDQFWETATAVNHPLSLSSRFISSAPDFTCGLSSGSTGFQTPHYRFTCAQKAGTRTYTLEQIKFVTPPIPKPMGTNAPPAKPQPPVRTPVVLDRFVEKGNSQEILLTLDALRPNELRARANGKTVCFTRPSRRPGGYQRLEASSAKGVRAEAPTISSFDTRPVERLEKNPMYVNDPFMRHWASPEGQWITLPDGRTWFKSDLTGPATLRFPVINPSVIHLGVPEDSIVSPCKIVVTNGAFSLYTPDAGAKPACTVPIAKFPKPDPKKPDQFFIIGINDHVLWIGGETGLLAQTHLAHPLPGRRIRAEGFKLLHLGQTQIRRENVFDTLFNESLHDWTLNGGRWEVINRFYCEPTWSHMNGESKDSLAAIWSKYVFSGDFSVDFYAGLRMGWYSRPGDLNLTVMSRSRSPSDGYSAITEGWDPDHSGIYNRLMRNGKQIAVSTKYTVPRYRSGNVRKGYQPLVAKGRDIHGAWYEMHFRRIGKKLKYIYDNEPLFETEDPDPVQDGALGVWTFKNSMMVARIRIAAESIRPRSFAFHALPAGSVPPAIPAAPADSGIRINGRNAELLSPAFWEAGDPVSLPILQFTGLGSPATVMKVTSLLGGGTFYTHCNLPKSEPGKLLGWHFEIARHPKAQVNFEFCSKAKNKKGEIYIAGRWSHILTGSDETRGPRDIAGRTDSIPPSTGTNWVWTPVDVWIPAIELRYARMIQIEGFGNLQPSDVVQGLQGNPPNAWFAVRNFREIHKGIPTVTGPAEKRAALANLMRQVAKQPLGKHHALPIPKELAASCPSVDWVSPAKAALPLKAVVDSRAKGAILLTHTDPWPCPFFPIRKALVDQHPCATKVDGNAVQIFVPHEFRKNGPMALEVTLSDNRVFKQQITLKPKVNEPPVLLSLKLPEGGIETFENRPCDVSSLHVRAQAGIEYGNSPHGDVLRISNPGSPARLNSTIIPKFNPIETPVVQFWYRGDAMAQASLCFGAHKVNFTERTGYAVRHGETPAEVDPEWRIWMGIPQDNEGTFPLSSRHTVSRRSLRMASMRNYDSTGLYSHMEIDDLTTGPAVGPKRVFAFQANYADPDGIAAVEYAILPGPLPYAKRPQDQTKKIAWATVKNGEVVQPSLANVPEGLHHLIVRAKDTPGAYSRIADQPFIHDRTGPEVSYQVAACPDLNGSRLKISIRDRQAPPVLGTLAFACLGRPLDLSRDFGTVHLGCGTIDYTIDWIWMLRKELATAKHGDILPVQVSGIVDASGNQAPPFRADIKLDLQSDKRAPAVPPPALTKNLFCYIPEITELEQLAKERGNLTAKIVKTPEGSVLDLITTEKKNRYLRHHFSTPWDPDVYPWLALSFRCVDAPPSAVGPFSISLYSGKRRPRGIKDSHTFDFCGTNSLPFLVCKPLKSIKADEWVDVLINARDFLRNESAAKKETPDITYITFYPRRKLDGKHIQIRSLAVLGPWKSDHLLALKPYDLNCIKNLTWEGGGETPLTGIRPAQIVIPERTPHAFRFRISDRKGNQTGVWTIPIPPDSTRDKPAFKPFEKVEY